ncbi:MAG: cation transporter [Candidatus Thermoplasmatota archaeon]|nr:cation transporter [Candidatus Thermoplasmatota archaeon]
MNLDEGLECMDPHSPLLCGPDEEEHVSPYHHSDVSRSDRRLVVGAMSVTGVVMIAELAGGFLTNSLALISDSIHMLTHFLSLVIALSAMFLASLPRSNERTFGLYRAEVLAALINGLGLLLFCGFIIYEAYHRLVDRPDLEVGPMLAVAVIGLLANLLSAYLLIRAKRHDLNIKGAMAHMLADTMSSGAIIVVGVIMIFWPRYEMDALVSVIIAVLILVWSLRIIRDSSRILLELTPKGMDLENVFSEMKAIAGVTDVHDIHAWEITMGLRMMTSHVCISPKEMKRDGGRRITSDLRTMLKERYQVVHTTFQLECPSLGSIDGDH